MIYAQTRIPPKNETHKIFWDFVIETDHSIPVRKSDVVLINKKKINCLLLDFAVPANLWVKVKEGEKIEKYLDFC